VFTVLLSTFLTVSELLKATNVQLKTLIERSFKRPGTANGCNAEMSGTPMSGLVENVYEKFIIKYFKNEIERII
jgi:hypothetical protein